MSFCLQLLTQSIHLLPFNPNLFNNLLINLTQFNTSPINQIELRRLLSYGGKEERASSMKRKQRRAGEVELVRGRGAEPITHLIEKKRQPLRKLIQFFH